MKATLVDLYQHRMDRCQSEQFWAVAVYAAVNGFVVTQGDRIIPAIQRGYLLFALLIVGALGLVFVYERLAGYYNYRNQIAQLLANETEADAFIKTRKSIWNPNGIVWLVVFALAFSLPFLVTAKVTEPHPAPLNPISTPPPAPASR
jgi:hypothetical protein